MTRPERLVRGGPCGPDRDPTGNEVTVVVDISAALDVARYGRVSTPSSACGLCGRDEIAAVVVRAPVVRREVRSDARTLASLPEQMRARQRVFRRTGGLHAAALARADGCVLVVREDVGLLNAVDKVVGHALLHRLGTADVLMMGGRAGFEVVQKAAMAPVPVVASVSARTSLAVDGAQACGGHAGGVRARWAHDRVRRPRSCGGYAGHEDGSVTLPRLVRQLWWSLRRRGGR